LRSVAVLVKSTCHAPQHRVTIPERTAHNNDHSAARFSPMFGVRFGRAISRAIGDDGSIFRRKCGSVKGDLNLPPLVRVRPFEQCLTLMRTGGSVRKMGEASKERTKVTIRLPLVTPDARV